MRTSCFDSLYLLGSHLRSYLTLVNLLIHEIPSMSLSSVLWVLLTNTEWQTIATWLHKSKEEFLWVILTQIPPFWWKIIRIRQICGDCVLDSPPDIPAFHDVTGQKKAKRETLTDALTGAVAAFKCITYTITPRPLKLRAACWLHVSNTDS